MAIKNMRVENFKSFRELEVELSGFNVLIGANASGKSNFIQIFQFLRDIMNHDLDNAISMQGGVEYLRNINIGSSGYFSINFVFDHDFRLVARKKKEDFIGVKTYEVIYEFSMRFGKRKPKYEIVLERLKLKCNFFRLEAKERRIEEKEKLGKGEIIFYRANGGVKVDLRKDAKVLIKKTDITIPFLEEIELGPSALIIKIPLFTSNQSEIFTDISIYDFDPKLPKKATPITGKLELEENGSNLSIVLKNIIEDKNKKRKLFNLISDLLPFIDDLNVEKFADKSLLFKLREKYFKRQYLPASLISDGTINTTAMIIALYFENKLLTIIEEPERNIHPYLISKVVDMMKEASQKKQIIVTTHNPEIVKYADLENILLVSRDEEGFSTISKPANKDDVKTFLKNEIGIEELYVQNLLRR